MKTKNIIAVTLALFLGLAGTAYANADDDNDDIMKESCPNLLKAAKDQDEGFQFTLLWIEGRLSVSRGDTRIDSDRMEKTAISLLEFCAANPEKTLGDAINSLTQ